jgi:hypothetical protein
MPRPGRTGAHGGHTLASLHDPLEIFAVCIRQARPMPACSPAVSGDEDLRMVFEYVRFLAEPARVADFPLLRDALDELE